MTWQNGRKLTSLQQGSNNLSYKYDSNGLRTSKTVNGVEYTYEYLNGLLMHETRGDKTFDYCYDANGQLYAVSYKAPEKENPTTYYFSHNWRGDIIGVYNTPGTLMASYEYDTWGNVISVKNSSGIEITDQNHIANLNPFRYRGYYYDSETGLYYLMSRYYDPVTHRFVNADGYFQSGSNILDTNMNAYCRNNPITNFDPTGEACTKHGCYYVPTCYDCSPSYAEFCKNNPEFIEKAKSIGDDYTKKSTNYDTSFSDGVTTAGNALNGIRTVTYGLAGGYVDTVGCAAGLSAIATIPATTLSIISHANNPYLTSNQKTQLIIADCVIAGVGILLSAALAATPIGWVGVGIGMCYNIVTTVGISMVESKMIENNKRNEEYL